MSYKHHCVLGGLGDDLEKLEETKIKAGKELGFEVLLNWVDGK